MKKENKDSKEEPFIAKDEKDVYKSRHINVLSLGNTPKDLINTFSLKVAGYNVVGAFRTTFLKGKGSDVSDSVSLALSTAFAICGDEDRYDEEDGESMAIGRVLKRFDPDLITTATLENLDSWEATENLSVGGDNYAYERVKSLEEYLIERNALIKEHKTREQHLHKDLAERVEKFK